jgi:hypothetical protein
MFKTSEIIQNTILGVLQRPRFNIQVTDATGRVGIPVKILSHDGYQYRILFSGSKRRTSVSVLAMNDWNREGIFYAQDIDHYKMPNVRRIGLIIANKIKMRVFYQITSA